MTVPPAGNFIDHFPMVISNILLGNREYLFFDCVDFLSDPFEAQSFDELIGRQSTDLLDVVECILLDGIVEGVTLTTPVNSRPGVRGLRDLNSNYIIYGKGFLIRRVILILFFNYNY